MENNEEKVEILGEKVRKEFSKFQEKMLEYSKEEILNRAYEYAMKSEIENVLENEYGMEEEELDILINTQEVIDMIYHAWLKNDMGMTEMLEDTIDIEISNIKRYRK